MILLKEPLAEPEARRILHYAGCAVYYSLPIASRAAAGQAGTPPVSD